MRTERKRAFATRAVHVGELRGDEGIRPTSTPIYNASSFLAGSVTDINGILAGEIPGYAYTRDGNPTVAAFERAIANLEGAEGGVAFGSGMAAIHASLLAAGIQSGKRVVASRDSYGRTRALLSRLESDFDVTVDLADLTDLASAGHVLGGPLAAVLVETLSNPLVKVADIRALSDLAHAAGGSLIVDATFSTPVLSQPMESGADIVVHSATKYLGGHGDVTGGIACAQGDALKRLRTAASVMGGILGPNEAWLCLRGVKTLLLRVERQCANAALIARHLSLHKRVAHAYYPGLPGDPGHRLAQDLFGGRFGAIIAFELRDAAPADVLAFMGRLQLILPAPTLGDVATLISYPAQSSHRGLSAAERAELGISDSLVRLSVGIEDINDVISDLEQALALS
ncbi:MAG: trans-sulfuration enzyme family protein [Chloroflexota bacterium]